MTANHCTMLVAPENSRVADRPCGREMRRLKKTVQRKLVVWACPRCDAPHGGTASWQK